MRSIILLAALLGGCNEYEGQSETQRQAETAALAQKQLAKVAVACRDGVQYFVYPIRANSGIAITPRIKQDGKPYLCTRQPSAFKEQPVE